MQLLAVNILTESHSDGNSAIIGIAKDARGIARGQRMKDVCPPPLLLSCTLEGDEHCAGSHPPKQDVNGIFENRGCSKRKTALLLSLN